MDDSTLQTRIASAAERLTVRFTRVADLPTKQRLASRRDAADTAIEANEAERRFANNVAAWTRVIETLLDKLEQDRVWRIVSLFPTIPHGARGLTEVPDFVDLVDYLVLRRDEEGCDEDELGLLAALLTALQREVEMQMGHTV